MKTNFHCYWLIKLADPKGIGEAIGILSFTEDDNITFSMISNAVGLRHNEWTWVVISKALFETYKAFGFKEYKL